MLCLVGTLDLVVDLNIPCHIPNPYFDICRFFTVTESFIISIVLVFSVVTCDPSSPCAF